MNVRVINIDKDYEHPNHMKDLQKMLTENKIPYDVTVYGADNKYYRTTWLYYPSKETIRSSVVVIENLKNPYKNKRLEMDGLIEPGLKRKPFGGKRQKRLTAEVVFARLKNDWRLHQLEERINNVSKMASSNYILLTYLVADLSR